MSTPGSIMSVGVAMGVVNPPVDAHTMEQCSLCAAPIYLQPPSFDRPARPWLCGGCGSVYFASAVDASAGGRSGKARVVPYAQVVDIVAVNADAPDRRLPRRALRQLVRFLATRRPDAEDNRKEPRFPAVLPVIAIPLGRNFRIIGNAVQMTTINVSKSGVALLDIDDCMASYFALEFAAAGISSRAIMEVLRHRPMLSAQEVAGRLKCRIIDAP